MGLFSWLTGAKATDYETVLAQLATQIDDAKQNLAEIRLRQRRFTLAVNAYGLGLWAIVLSLWYFGGLPWALIGWDAEGTEARVVGVVGVVAAPFLIWILNRAISWIFVRKRTSEETHLRLLLNKQRDQVEKIKKATNFDTTRKLLEQYEDSPMGTPQRGHAQSARASPSPSTPSPGARGRRNSASGTPGPVTPAGQAPASQGPGGPGQQAPMPGTPHAPGHLAPRPQTPVPIPQGFTPEQAAVLQLQMQAITPVLPTPEKKWYDRLADTILGDDPAQAAQNKYALVCGECFRHNGLVGSKYEWERMQWICPRCNHLNKSPLSRMAAEDAEPSSPLPGAEGNNGNGGAPSTRVTSIPPETPSKPAKTTARAQPTASPLRRAVGERSARSSRLGQEVFSASDAEDDEGYEAKSDEAMDLDK